VRKHRGKVHVFDTNPQALAVQVEGGAKLFIVD
jgi:hypothetical protein